MTTETWVWIAGFEGQYEVSDHGGVRSWRRDGYRWKNRPVPAPMTVSTLRGYKMVLLPCATAKRGWKSQYVHRLVAAAFIRPPQEGETVNHLNMDKADNRVQNLQWCSLADNIRYSSAVTPRIRGEAKPCAKLDEDKVRAIRRAHASGALQTALARQYGVSAVTINLIVHRKKWAHVTD